MSYNNFSNWIEIFKIKHTKWMLFLSFNSMLDNKFRNSSGDPQKSSKIFVHLRRSSGQSISEQSDRWPLFLVFKGVPGCIEGIPGCSVVFRECSGVFQGCSGGVPGCSGCVPGCSNRRGKPGDCKTRNTLEHPGTPPEHPGTSPEHPRNSPEQPGTTPEHPRNIP